jgi:hypothetical protein
LLKIRRAIAEVIWALDCQLITPTLRRHPELLAGCWEDADTEALELDRHKRVLADGGEDDYAETWGLLFDAGGDARANGVPFDEGRTQPWKEGWISADINVGLAGIED